MVRRRKTPSAGAPRGAHKPETPPEAIGPIASAARPSESPGLAEPEAIPSVPLPAESVHDVLLESVSPEALQRHDEAPSDTVPDTVVAPLSEQEPEPTSDPEPAVEAANDVAPSDASVVETNPVPIVVPARAAAAPAFRKTSALDALHELSESNATVVAFLRNEGSATLAHWRSLAKARSPADVVRLQVDEMQRAADASLTCVSNLARSAGRFATLLGRR